MARKRKTDEEFKLEVVELVGDEYTFLEEYRGSSTKISVKHEECGRLYETTPNNFLKGRRCPKCSRKISATNKLKSNDDFINEVKGLVGDEYTFLETYQGSATNISVKHGCGYEYEVKPNDFLSGKRCPKCSGLMKKTTDQFLNEVSVLVGNEYTFLEEYYGTNNKIAVKHEVCSHEYYVTPKDFLRGSRCPKCSYKIRASNRTWTNDRFLREVEEAEGGDEYEFLAEYQRGKMKLPVRHITCNHVYEVAPSEFLRSNSRCPNCFYSRGEYTVKSSLDVLEIDYIREHSFEQLGRRRFDFYIPTMNACIEYDGSQHFETVECWGGMDGLIRTQESDHLKNEYCANNGIHLLRIPYWDFDRVDEIVTDFINEIKTNPDELITPNYVPLIQRTPSLT